MNGSCVSGHNRACHAHQEEENFGHFGGAHTHSVGNSTHEAIICDLDVHRNAHWECFCTPRKTLDFFESIVADNGARSSTVVMPRSLKEQTYWVHGKLPAHLSLRTKRTCASSGSCFGLQSDRGSKLSGAKFYNFE